MKKLPLILIGFAGILLSECASVRHLGSKSGEEEVGRNKHLKGENFNSMRELLCNLPPGSWEIPPAHWLKENYPKGVPEDFVFLPDQGAQCAVIALRLDDNMVAVLFHSEICDGSDSLVIYRHLGDGMYDVTTGAFPVQIDKKLRIKLRQDRTVLVSSKDGQHSQRYVWRGSQFIAE